jgi:hypothetical protein
MPRTIHARVRTSAVQTTDCIASLLALELLNPSKQIYLSATSIRNSPVIVNNLGQFSSLFPEVDTPQLSLATALSLLAEGGANIYLVYSSNDMNSEEFVSMLPAGINYRTTASLIPKGLFSEHFCLHGGLRFTEVGIDVAEDSLELVTEPQEVNRLLLDMAQYWEDLA